LIKTQPQAHWQALMEGSDACFAPVLDFAQAAQHPHNQARGLFVQVQGEQQVAPAPRLSRSQARAPAPGAHSGEHTEAVLAQMASAPGWPAAR
jgi:alpha-methylacyl-CoA racemase